MPMTDNCERSGTKKGNPVLMAVRDERDQVDDVV